MNHASLMCRRQAQGNLARDGDRFLRRQLTARPEPGVQRLALASPGLPHVLTDDLDLQIGLLRGAHDRLCAEAAGCAQILLPAAPT